MARTVVIVHKEVKRGNNHALTIRGGNQGNTYNPDQPSLNDLVFGQAKINEGFNKKTAAYDKDYESLNVKIDSLSYALKNQPSFNKMIETQLV
jgi:hypothetical protein